MQPKSHLIVVFYMVADVIRPRLEVRPRGAQRKEVGLL
jgi:hypothetical protein